MDIKFKPWELLVSVPLVIVLALVLWQSSSSQSGIKYYGHYFVEDPGKNQAYVQEVKDWTNIINMRYDNGPNNSWDPTAASRVRNAGVKVMLQVPFGTDSDQTLFVNATARDAYLNKLKQDMINTNFMPSLAYIAIYEEWYVLISQGFYDKWPIFQGKTKEQKFAIAKSYLEQIIDDVHNKFPGIPTVIVENILPYPAPPSNVDVLGIDAYYIPDNSSCDSGQRAKFEQEVLPYFDAAAVYNKPMMMVPPSFIGGPWKMLSECQMQWYADLALSGQYNIESFVWFFWANTSGFTGVRNYPNLVNYQKVIACYMLGGSYCIVPTLTPTPPPSGPVTYKVNLQANNGQYVVAEGNGGGAINANRDVASLWETFDMVDLNGGQIVSGDKVGFSTSDGYYFRAEGGGGSTMDATARSLGAWETFTIEKASEGGTKTTIRTWNGNYFVVAEGGGGEVVNANRTAAYAWETFTLRTVGSPPTIGTGNLAQFVSQTVPTSMVASQTYPVSVRMKNTGGTTWTLSEEYRLGSQNPQDNFTWGLARVDMPNSVSPDQEATFNFVVRAPSGPGNYDFQWRMLRELVEWFGEYGPNVAVNVTVASGYSVSGYVYRDLNTSTCCGGVKDQGEPGLSGRTVYLRDSADTVDIRQPAVTDSNGFYRFTNIPVGNYRIKHPVPAGYTRTTDDSTPFNLGSSFIHNFGLYRL